jgi:predicted dithiol-disulfide oxidoreductase (DUF899 family)
MENHAVATRAEWLEARRALLAEEKAFTRARDALSAKRRELPWVRIDKPYRFQGPEGELRLSDLFGPHRQLIVQHFMFAPDWEKPCKSCSFWADGFNGIVPHLAHRDTAFVAVSRAPLAKLEARKRKMGWTFPWVSSGGSDFNYDFAVSFRDEDMKAGTATYNYGPKEGTMSDLPGISAFIKGGDGTVYHTYSCFARGLDLMNPAYNYLDLTALGRQEDDLPFSMSWVRLRDEYAA